MRCTTFQCIQSKVQLFQAPLPPTFTGVHNSPLSSVEFPRPPKSMAYELPTDLIQQVKRSTRAEAGLSHYDPGQTPLPPLPSLSETVASFDPSPPYLRCKNCRGRLLRGVQSLFCIYCGRRNDVVPDPISFKDTFAYRWLLESLHLNGSETVGPLSEKGELNRVQSRPKAEISLSDLLDFKITWPAEEQGEINASKKKLVERSYLNLTGIDLDNFFHESRRTDASITLEEHPVTNNDVVAAKINGVATHDNLSFFENVKASESAVQSSKYENNDAFSGWEADFHSANSGKKFSGSSSFDPSVDSTAAAASSNQRQSSKPPDPFGGSTVDISSQLDSVFGPAKRSKDGTLEGNLAVSPSMGDWTSNNLWNNSNLEASLQNEQPDPTVSVKDTLPQENTCHVDFSLQLDSVFGPVKDLKDGNQKNNLATSPSIGDWTSDDLWNNLNKEAFPQTEQPDATVRAKDVLPQDNMGNLSTSLDWFQVEQWQNNTSSSANDVMNGNDILFDDWNDFTSSTHVQDSTETAATESHKQSMPASESTSEKKLSSSDDNLEEMDFGSFSLADPFQSSSGKGNVSTEMNNIGLEVSASGRMGDAKTDRDEGDGQLATSADVHSDSTQSRVDVDMLLSQMHDLSFMLDDNLSLPPKSDALNSFP